MSDTPATPDRSVAFVRTEMLTQDDPPVTSVGPIGWARENLFSSWLNGILSVAALALIFLAIDKLLGWAWSPTWAAASLNECRDMLHVLNVPDDGAACWGVIRDRWLQLLMGFYPAADYWRPILAFVLLFVAIAPVLFADKVSRKLLVVTAIYPFLMPWLLWGGNIWMPILVAAGFVLGYLAYHAVEPRVGHLSGLIAAVLVPVVWWLFAISPINGGLNALVTSMRATSASVTMQAKIDALTPQIDYLQTVVNDVSKSIKAQEAHKADLLKQYDAEMAASDGNAQTPKARALAQQYLDAVALLSGPRNERSGLLASLQDKKDALAEATRVHQGLTELPDHLAKAADLSKKVAELRGALPADLQNRQTTDNLPDTVSKEDATKLQDLLTAESDLLVEQNAVDETRSTVGRVGLQPVTSRNLGGMLLSLTIGVVAIACSLPLGILLALGRQSSLFIVKTLSVGFIEFIRGVPLITLLFVASTLLNYFLPPGTNFDIVLRVIIMATLFSSAYMAEVIRGGLAALPKGQYEGADSLGLDYWQAQRLIIMPQALKISIPGIVSTFIGLFKDTTLVSIIGLFDPLGLAKAIVASTDWNGIVWELYSFIALLFWIFCFSMSRYSMYLERKLNKANR